MRPAGIVVASSLALVAAIHLVVTGWRHRPALVVAIDRLRRPAPTPRHGADEMAPDDDLPTMIGRRVLAADAVRRRVVPAATLRLIGRSPETHAGFLALAAILGLLVPSGVALVAIALGSADRVPVAVPAAVSLLAAGLAPWLVHSAAIARADEVRVDVRHQLSAFLDVVTMLLAGNTGHEGAIDQAASAGDGLLFRELRRRSREVATTGESQIVALSIVADDLELAELEQVAAAASLTAAEGAPVARTLAAKCASLRSTLGADAEAQARIRNEKVTPPLVGMALLFMVLLVYPALDL